MFENKLSGIVIQLTDTLLIPYVNTQFGAFIDFICPIILSKSQPIANDLVDPNEQVFFQIGQPTPSTISVNGMRSSTFRGCIWKLMYANLDYILQHEYG